MVEHDLTKGKQHCFCIPIFGRPTFLLCWHLEGLGLFPMALNHAYCILKFLKFIHVSLIKACAMMITDLWDSPGGKVWDAVRTFSWVVLNLCVPGEFQMCHRQSFFGGGGEGILLLSHGMGSFWGSSHSSSSQLWGSLAMTYIDEVSTVVLIPN